MSANGVHPMETGCRDKSLSDCFACQFARDLVNPIKVLLWLWWGWKMSANGLHRIRWRRVFVTNVRWTVLLFSSRESLVNIQQSRIVVVVWVENVGKRIRWRRVAVVRVHRNVSLVILRDA